MNPFCPVCRKRTRDASQAVEVLHDACIGVCSECGTVYDAAISERLAPKCGVCGTPGEMRDGAIICEACGKATVRRALVPPPDPRDARIRELEEALAAAAADCDEKCSICDTELKSYCGVKFARALLEKQP